MNKPPKGMRDYGPNDMAMRHHIFNKVVSHFKRYGGQQIDTPVAELVSTVTNLYGEEFNKQVYKLEDQGGDNGEKSILRYDLTVPFARYVASNGIEVFRRFQIGKVYRRDQPQIVKGRFREFYQADFDIVGSDNGLMIQELEMLQLLVSVLEDLLGADKFVIKMNHRAVLYYVLSKFKVDDQKVGTICSSLDKLDKLTIDEIAKELVNEKGIDGPTCDNVCKFITIFNELAQKTDKPMDILTELITLDYIDDKVASSLGSLFEACDNMSITKNIRFVPTLARGLDYYTGIIYEAEYTDKEIMPSSVAAGGRYDEMLGKLSAKGNVPAIGLSIGIERIVAIYEQLGTSFFASKPDIFIATIGKDMVKHRVKLCLELRKLGIIADMSYSANPKMAQQFKKVFDDGIPFMMVIGQTEIDNGTVNLKNIKENTQVTMTREDAINTVVSFFKK